MEEVSIIIPAYNEREGITHVIESLRLLKEKHGPRWEIIVVDDGSTDGTPEMVKEFEDVILIQHPLNRGYGAAIKTGMRHAKYNTLVISDADGTYPVNDIPKLIAQLPKSDMVVGARHINSSNIPLSRRPAKWVLNKLANYLTGTKIPDLNSGLRVMKKDIVMNYVHLLPDGFSFTTTITLAMLTNNYRVEFVPIEYKIRSGKSKIRPIRDTMNFIQLIIRTVLYFDPLKIFLPISAFFFISSIAVLILSYLFTPKVMDITTVILFISGVQILAIGMIADLIDKKKPIMKILLINPPSDNELQGNNPSIIEEERGYNPPLGILYIAGYLEKHTNFSVEVLDTQADEIGYDHLKDRILANLPDVVGITAMTFTLIDVIKVINLIKSIRPKIKVVLGGPHVHIYPEETINIPGVDFSCLRRRGSYL